jgi:hypothetical protein
LSARSGNNESSRVIATPCYFTSKETSDLCRWAWRGLSLMRTCFINVSNPISPLIGQLYRWPQQSRSE